MPLDACRQTGYYNSRMVSADRQNSERPSRGQFATTQWSLILSAADQSSPRWQQSLSQLCQLYWYPLYAFVRRQGCTASEAEDLTQEFFLRVLEKGYLDAAGPEKGKFRTFLLVCLRRFLANEHDRQTAQKRGGGNRVLSIDFAVAESHYQLEPADPATPQRVFERRWALALLDLVMRRLQSEYAESGKAALFDRLKVFLVCDEAPARYSDLERELNVSASALKVAVHRMRRRYGQLLSAEIARTLDAKTSVQEEINALITALGQPK
jgi:RNA polymerase sigma-70 factor (ECF subfamily)